MFLLVALQELQSFANCSLYEVQKYIFEEKLLTSAIQLVGKQKKYLNSEFFNYKHPERSFSPHFVSHLCLTSVI